MICHDEASDPHEALMMFDCHISGIYSDAWEDDDFL